MEDGESMIEHLNSFNTLISKIISIDIEMEEEDKCITLLCYLPKSRDDLIITIGSTTQSALKFEDVVASLSSKEIRRKSMENQIINALSVRGHPKDRINNYIRGRSKYRGRSKSPKD